MEQQCLLHCHINKRRLITYIIVSVIYIDSRWHLHCSVACVLHYSSAHMKRVCLTQEVFRGQGFNELSEDALSFILQSDRLKMDEEDILAKVTEWATVNSVSSERENVYFVESKTQSKSPVNFFSYIHVHCTCIHVTCGTRQMYMYV